MPSSRAFDVIGFNDRDSYDAGKVYQAISALFNTGYFSDIDVFKEDDGFTIVGDTCNIKVIPLNYSLDDAGYKMDGIDGELRDVNLIYINSKVNKEYEFKTKLIILEK